METFAQVAPEQAPGECLAALHELEDEDVRSGACTAFGGASELLSALRARLLGTASHGRACRSRRSSWTRLP